jgi:hypothetical protein
VRGADDQELEVKMALYELHGAELQGHGGRVAGAAVHCYSPAKVHEQMYGTDADKFPVNALTVGEVQDVLRGIAQSCRLSGRSKGWQDHILSDRDANDEDNMCTGRRPAGERARSWSVCV